MSVLIVEDEPLIRMELVDDVASAGMDVCDASDACGALEVLSARDDVSVVVTDIDMPGRMDGIELARLVAARSPSIAVIVTSGRRTPSPGSLPPGGRFVPKPYDPRRVVELVREAERRVAPQKP